MVLYFIVKSGKYDFLHSPSMLENNFTLPPCPLPVRPCLWRGRLKRRRAVRATGLMNGEHARDDAEITRLACFNLLPVRVKDLGFQDDEIESAPPHYPLARLNVKPPRELPCRDVCIEEVP